MDNVQLFYIKILSPVSTQAYLDGMNSLGKLLNHDISIVHFSTNSVFDYKTDFGLWLISPSISHHRYSRVGFYLHDCEKTNIKSDLWQKH